ncbi:MAG: peptidoglycan-binding protein LysM [Bacteroidota bacterium]
MGIFDFLKGIGKKAKPGQEADEIKQNITEKLGAQVDDLGVAFTDGTVTLTGTVADAATQEKAVLLAGNVEGVAQVDDQLTVRAAEVEEAAPEPTFYTIQRGDSLSKIAKAQYGDAMKWQALFEANREVIENPDLIYPGQRIRIPAMDA